jgi:hypothetical protein
LSRRAVSIKIKMRRINGTKRGVQAKSQVLIVCQGKENAKFGEKAAADTVRRFVSLIP